MRIIKSFALVIGILLANLGLTITALAAPIVMVPTSIGPGEDYRLAFITSLNVSATSGSYSTYKDLVLGFASALTDPFFAIAAAILRT